MNYIKMVIEWIVFWGEEDGSIDRKIYTPNRKLYPVK